MPRYGSLERLIEERFPDDPQMHITKARRLCRNGHIPGARKFGREWWIDLEVFDAEHGADRQHALTELVRKKLSA